MTFCSHSHTQANTPTQTHFLKKVSHSHSHRHADVRELESADEVAKLNYSQHKAKCLQSCANSNHMRGSLPSLSPSASLSLPQRFGVLWMSLAPCSLYHTRLSSAESIFEDNLRCDAPWWLGFEAAAPAAIQTLTRRRRA